MSKQSKISEPSNAKVLKFIVGLCLVCGLSLAIAAYTLQTPQDNAKEFDRNKQMMIAAKLLNPMGYFELLQNETFVPARFDKDSQLLVADTQRVKATSEEIKEEGKLRIRPLLVDIKGNVTTFAEAKISLVDYLIENKKEGYASLALKLFYAILPNTKEASSITEADVALDLSKAESYVFPISGFGLWAPIFGYIAVSSDGDTVLGTTWYEHAETPGLGANITEPWWQKQFYGKVIFQESSNGNVDFSRAPMGIIVVKGKVRDVFGSSTKAKSAVDGISGATFTGDGVTAAYRESLNPYRNLLIRINTQKGSEKHLHE